MVWEVVNEQNTIKDYIVVITFLHSEKYYSKDLGRMRN